MKDFKWYVNECMGDNFILTFILAVCCFLWVYVFPSVCACVCARVCVVRPAEPKRCPPELLSLLLWLRVQELFITASAHLREERNNAQSPMHITFPFNQWFKLSPTTANHSLPCQSSAPLSRKAFYQKWIKIYRTDRGLNDPFWN